MAQKTVKLKTTDEVISWLREKFHKSPVKEIGYLTLEELLILSSPLPQEKGRIVLRDRLKRIEHYGYSPYVAFIVHKLYDEVAPYVVLPPPARLAVLNKDMVFNVVTISVADLKSCVEVVREIDEATGYAADYNYSVLCGDKPGPVPQPSPPPRKEEEEEEEEKAGEEEAVGRMEKETVKMVTEVEVPKPVLERWSADETFRSVVKAMAQTDNPEVAYFKLGDAVVRLAEEWPQITRQAPAPSPTPPAPQKCDLIEAVMRTYGLPEAARNRVDALLVALEPVLSNIHTIPEVAFKRILQALSKLS